MDATDITNGPGKLLVQGVKGTAARLMSMTVGIKGAYDCVKAFSETDLTEDLKTDWGRFLPEHTTAVSLLDRLLHHANIVITEGESIRMREAKAKGGATTVKS